MPIINQLKRKGINIYYIGLDEARIPNDSIQSLEFESVQEILMVGYPHGIWDSYNNLPIVRKGITATPSYIDYNGKKEFLVDIATFAGSSGSPVYVYRELWQPKKIGYAPKYGRSLFLVGIVRAMPVYNVDGKVSGDSSQIVHSNIPMNLAYVIKASKLADFKKLFTPDK